MSVPLSYTLDGPDGAPVLVLGSSLGTSREMWQPQVEALRQRFRVLRYDHRGHGGSPVPPGPYRLEDLGRDVIALLDVLELEQVHLGGLSLGGMVAMWVAAHHPSRVSHLALLCTAAKLGPPEMWQERAALVRSGGTAAIADAVIGRWFTPGFAARQPGVVGWARRLLVTTPGEGYASCCGAVENMDLFGDLAAIKAPTLVVGGGADPATPVSHQEVIASGIAGASLSVVDDAAHLANVEQPEAVSRLLLDFLP